MRRSTDSPVEALSVAPTALRQYLLMGALVVAVCTGLVAGLLADAFEQRDRQLAAMVEGNGYRTDVVAGRTEALAAAINRGLSEVVEGAPLSVDPVDGPAVLGVQLFDSVGHPVDGRAAGEISLSFLDAPEVVRAHRDYGLDVRISPPVAFPGLSVPVMVASRRIVEVEGRLVGIAVAYVDPHAFLEVLDSVDYWSAGETWLLDAEDRPLIGTARSPTIGLRSLDSSGEAARTLFARVPDAARRPETVRFDARGETVAVHSHAVSGLPLRLIHVTDLDEIVRGWWRTVLVPRIGLAFVVVVLVGGLLAVLYRQARRRGEIERSLSDSEERFRQFADTADLVFWVRTATRMLFVSNGYVKLFGRSVDSLYENPNGFLDAVHADDRPRILAALDAEFSVGGIFNEEYRILRPNGEERWVHARSFGVRDRAGRLVRWTGIAQDITERKHIALQLETSRRRLEEAQTIARLGHWEANLDTGGLWWSDIVYEIFGRDPVTFAPTLDSFYQAVRPKDQAKVRAAQQAAEDSGLHDVEHRIIRPDGSIRWVHEAGRLQVDPSGRLVRLIGTVRDITATKQAQAEIEALAQRNELILNSVGEGIYGVDPEGYVTFINDAALRMLGFDRAEVLAQEAHALFHRSGPDDPTNALADCPMHRVLRDGQPRRSDDRSYWRKDGGRLPIDALTMPIVDRGGRLQGAVTTFRDISERQEMERGLRQAEAVFAHSPDGIMVTDADNRIVAVNPAFTAITGYRFEQVVGRNPSILSSGRLDPFIYEVMWARLVDEGLWQGEVLNRKADGTEYPQRLSIVQMRDRQGESVGFIALFSDITERKAQEERIRHQANYDQLTGLPNRALFHDRLQQAVARAHRQRERVALLFLDLDHFKEVNDTLGHAAGDALLCQAADRLRAALRETDTVARMGGDEFTVILAEISGREAALHVANKLVAAMAEPFHVAEQEHFLGASIGISLYPDDGDSVDVLLRQADAAMYRAKAEGRGRSAVFDETLNAEMQDRIALARDLRQALAADGLHLHYQPQIEIATGRVVGLEALARWHHPERGPVPPMQFIPIAEEASLIHELGDSVVRTACRQILAWREEGLPVPPVAVNLSPHQMRARGFADRLFEQVSALGLTPAALALEITENVLIGDSPDVLANLQALHDHGFTLAIDDFGTGYSSLSYLRRFAAHALKIDRSFVQDLPDSADSRVLVETIIAMGHALGLVIVAEGVETPAQLRFLADLKCDQMQGYIVSPAVAASEAAGFLRGPVSLGRGSDAPGDG